MVPNRAGQSPAPQWETLQDHVTTDSSEVEDGRYDVPPHRMAPKPALKRKEGDRLLQTNSVKRPRVDQDSGSSRQPDKPGPSRIPSGGSAAGVAGASAARPTDPPKAAGHVKSNSLSSQPAPYIDLRRLVGSALARGGTTSTTQPLPLKARPNQLPSHTKPLSRPRPRLSQPVPNSMKSASHAPPPTDAEIIDISSGDEAPAPRVQPPKKITKLVLNNRFKKHLGKPESASAPVRMKRKSPEEVIEILDSDEEEEVRRQAASSKGAASGSANQGASSSKTANVVAKGKARYNDSSDASMASGSDLPASSPRSRTNAKGKARAVSSDADSDASMAYAPASDPPSRPSSLSDILPPLFFKPPTLQPATAPVSQTVPVPPSPAKASKIEPPTPQRRSSASNSTSAPVTSPPSRHVSAFNSPSRPAPSGSAVTSTPTPDSSPKAITVSASESPRYTPIKKPTLGIRAGVGAGAGVDAGAGGQQRRQLAVKSAALARPPVSVPLTRKQESSHMIVSDSEAASEDGSASGSASESHSLPRSHKPPVLRPSIRPRISVASGSHSAQAASGTDAEPDTRGLSDALGLSHEQDASAVSRTESDSSGKGKGKEQTQPLPSLPRLRRIPSFSNGLSAEPLLFEFKTPYSSICTGWKPAEIAAGRRLVRFSKAIEGRRLIVSCETIPLEAFEEANTIISCIYHAHRKKTAYYVTTSDVIHLLEWLVNVRFSAEEKKRMRRDFERYRPSCVSNFSDHKSGFVELYYRIIEFPDPKPSNTKNDIKVFDWVILDLVLKRFLSKYSVYAAKSTGVEQEEVKRVPLPGRSGTHSRTASASSSIPRTANATGHASHPISNANPVASSSSLVAPQAPTVPVTTARVTGTSASTFASSASRAYNPPHGSNPPTERKAATPADQDEALPEESEGLSSDVGYETVIRGSQLIVNKLEQLRKEKSAASVPVAASSPPDVTAPSKRLPSRVVSPEEQEPPITSPPPVSPTPPPQTSSASTPAERSPQSAPTTPRRLLAETRTQSAPSRTSVDPSPATSAITPVAGPSQAARLEGHRVPLPSKHLRPNSISSIPQHSRTVPATTVSQKPSPLGIEIRSPGTKPIWPPPPPSEPTTPLDQGPVAGLKASNVTTDVHMITDEETDAAPVTADEASESERGGLIGVEQSEEVDQSEAEELQEMEEVQQEVAEMSQSLAAASLFASASDDDDDDDDDEEIPEVNDRGEGASRRITRSSSGSSSMHERMPATPSSDEHTNALVETASDGYTNTAEDLGLAAAQRSPGKTYGGFPVLTWKEFRKDLRNFTPECLYAKDIPRALHDHVNRLSTHTRMLPAMRALYEAMIQENTAADEPDAPPVRIENPVDEEPTPAWEFYYTNKIFHGEGVPPPDIKSLVNCGCRGPCNPKSSTCACVKRQREAYGYQPKPINFAYDKAGHLLHPGYPIYECNDLCGCGDECMNRVVQHGRKVGVAIRKTPNKGWGIFATQKIASGQFIGIYSGELLTDHEAHERGIKYNKWGKTYLFDIDFHHLKDPEDKNWTNKFTVDAYHCGNFTRFLNHSCDPNSRLYPCYINEGNIQKPLLAIFSRRVIEADEEICFNYHGSYPGDDDDDEDKDKDEDGDEEEEPLTEREAKERDLIYEQCMCGAKNCTGTNPRSFCLLSRSLQLLSSGNADSGNIEIGLKYGLEAVNDVKTLRANSRVASADAEQCYMEANGYLGAMYLANDKIAEARGTFEESRAYFTDKVKERNDQAGSLISILRRLRIIYCSEGKHEEGHAAAQEVKKYLDHLAEVFPGLHKLVHIDMRHELTTPSLQILNRMKEQLSCDHQAEIF